VDDQQHGLLDGPNGVPSLLASHDAILAENCVRIIKNECCGLERDAAMLQSVDPVLFAIPFFRTASLYKMYNTHFSESR